MDYDCSFLTNQCISLVICSPFLELKRVLTIEREILNDSRLFSLATLASRSFRSATVFDWNATRVDDAWLSNEVNADDVYDRWKRSICERRPCQQPAVPENRIDTQRNTICIPIAIEEDRSKGFRPIPLWRVGPEWVLRLCLETVSDQQEDENSICLSSECSDDSLPLHEAVDQTESPPPLPPTPSDDIEAPLEDDSIKETHPVPTFDSLIHDLLWNGITSEQLSQPFDRPKQTALTKTDHSTSTSSLFPPARQPSNIAQSFLTGLFLFEKASSRNHTLERHEHWIADALASYAHPFPHHAHQSCALRLPPIESTDDKRKSNQCHDDYPRGSRSSK